MSARYKNDGEDDRRVTPLGALKLVGVGKALIIIAVILIFLTGVDRFRFMNGKTPVFARKSNADDREVYLGIGYSVEYTNDEEPEWLWFYE